MGDPLKTKFLEHELYLILSIPSIANRYLQRLGYG
jgi:hypothetical protein